MDAGEPHQIEKLLRLADGAPERREPEIFPSARDKEAVDLLLAETGVAGDFVALAPGSAWATKRWPYFPELGARAVDGNGGRDRGRTGRPRRCACHPDGAGQRARGRRHRAPHHAPERRADPARQGAGFGRHRPGPSGQRRRDSGGGDLRPHGAAVRFSPRDRSCRAWSSPSRWPAAPARITGRSSVRWSITSACGTRRSRRCWARCGRSSRSSACAAEGEA